MSYILDALRRAEADRERERGQVPGLHTHPSSGPEASATAGRRGWMPWAGAGVLLLAGVGVGLWLASAPPEVPQPAPVAPAQPPVSTPPAASVPPPPPAASASPYLPPAPPPAAVATPPAPAPEARIPRLAELPESTRRELPALAISGSVYSEDPAGRFVIINGEVQREGARLGPDLVLEQIGVRELVLRFRSQRYRQPV